jgi:hypothetical protein
MTCEQDTISTYYGAAVAHRNLQRFSFVSLEAVSIPLTPATIYFEIARHSIRDDDNLVAVSKRQ